MLASLRVLDAVQPIELADGTTETRRTNPTEGVSPFYEEEVDPVGNGIGGS